MALVAFKREKVIENVVDDGTEDVADAGRGGGADAGPFHAAPQHAVLHGRAGSADSGET
ncbi:hypothetical protein D3C72_2399760 [compost metagenome]